ncbi:GDSL-like Lipase/Acylhydrolase superfamily protein [Prunus dulcis]|uniref:GDSL-like Lipase/Acylhydrolase superfamily protein n=1 Tax=Prunus dulcis TaxID=3755 RepID=A0A4Y1RUY3_PRUDU|nr:GDSL-like Lipase/Acylhydrolase superfamily protein [Prunus dulcis]
MRHTFKLFVGKSCFNLHKYSLIKKFLLCERTNIIQPILRKEKEIPTILKWSLVELHTRFNQIEDLNDIESIFKTPKKRKTTREEKYPVDKVI